ncbi:hypothetical protein [Acidipropionibacterium jensenii]|uniref:hypothetical protein n=1 Tax=Acidipropionibacterium jensenii TaxID=1749 RepID=UPI00214CB6C8|nr:hypothetical protein [Acidipropionibacterium jensenii]
MYSIESLENRIKNLDNNQLRTLSVAASELIWPVLRHPHPETPVRTGTISAFRSILDALWLIVKDSSGCPDGSENAILERASTELSRSEEFEMQDPLCEDAIVSIYMTSEAVACRGQGELESVKWVIMRLIDAADYIALLDHPEVTSIDKDVENSIESSDVFSGACGFIDRYIDMTKTSPMDITKDRCMRDALLLDSIFRTVSSY